MELTYAQPKSPRSILALYVFHRGLRTFAWYRHPSGLIQSQVLCRVLDTFSIKPRANYGHVAMSVPPGASVDP